MAVIKKNIFSIVELGSSKITCVIFSLNSDGIKILGFTSAPSIGVKNGIISNVCDAIASISSVVERAENAYGKLIEEIFVIISGASIESEIIGQEILINGRDVVEKDIKNLVSRANETLNANNERAILHSINNGYSLDGLYVSCPTGMCANKLEVSTNFISFPRIPLININQVFAGCRLNIKDYLVSSYMDSFSCLSEDDKNIGASIINFGAQNTSVITFKNGCLASCYATNLGSEHITFDIAHAFGTSIINAEKIKLAHGALIQTDNYYEKLVIPSDNKGTEEIIIDKHDFLSVIQARQEEIIESLFARGSQLGQFLSERKIVLTGGGSKMTGLQEVLKNIIPSRVIKNFDNPSFDRINIDNHFSDAFLLNDPANSSIVGAINYIASLKASDGSYMRSTGRKVILESGILKKIFNLIKI